MNIPPENSTTTVLPTKTRKQMEKPLNRRFYFWQSIVALACIVVFPILYSKYGQVSILSQTGLAVAIILAPVSFLFSLVYVIRKAVKKQFQRQLLLPLILSAFGMILIIVGVVVINLYYMS